MKTLRSMLDQSLDAILEAYKHFMFAFMYVGIFLGSIGVGIYLQFVSSRKKRYAEYAPTD